MIWDNKSQQSKWSEIAYWQMGLLSIKDWINEQWIAYEKILVTLPNHRNKQLVYPNSATKRHVRKIKRAIRTRIALNLIR